MSDLNRAIIHKVMLSPVSDWWKTEGGRAIVLEQVRTAYLPEFKQVLNAAKHTMNPDFTLSQKAPLPAENSVSPLS